MSYRKECPYELKVVGSTSYRVPPAVIHTLLENAISHNDYGTTGACFELRTEPGEEGLRLEFRSPPGATTARADAAEGTGLGYVRARLEEVFPGRCRVETGKGETGWITRISCPAVAA